MSSSYYCCYKLLLHILQHMNAVSSALVFAYCCSITNAGGIDRTQQCNDAFNNGSAGNGSCVRVTSYYLNAAILMAASRVNSAAKA
jgi:hypothetical protein